jgi:hypothetical protein
MNSPKFRASFSILNSWSLGYCQDAIDMYFKLPRETNKYMEDGIKFHKLWQEYTEKNKKLHPHLSSLNKKLDDPKCELKLEMPINDHIELVGVIDCLDNHTLYEFKSGSKPSSEYANGKQVDVYSLLCEHHGYTPERAMYLHYDQYMKETDGAMVWLTPERRKQALEWIIKVSEEMHEHLLVNKLYEKYPKLEKVELIEELI